MLSSTYCFFFFLASSLFLSSEASPHIPSRRILHEPHSTLSSEPPSPIHPLSTSASSTPPGSPFFPSFPSAPPPPPPPSAFASFPANISSLLIPHTPSPKHHPHSLFILAIAAVFSASIIAAIIIFIYCRQRGRRRGGHNCFDDNKTPTSENSTTLYPNNNVVASRKLRTTTTTSSEFLYLGNMVNSQSRFEEGYNDSPDSSKMYSPELHPLPSLSRQNTCPDFRDSEVESDTEYEQEEEFYSPRGSLGGRESSSGIGSGSRRVVKSIESRSICSCSSSSSGSGSLTRSQFLNISPHASFSPRWPDSKSPEVVQVYRSSSPQRILVDSARVSDASLSSPNRVLIENLDASIKNFNAFVQNMKPPSILAPDATNSPPRDSSVCSSLNSPSPNRAFEESPKMSPLKVVFSDYNKAPSLSSLASSSPERGLEKSLDHASPLSLSKALQKPILSPPPPKQQRLWETPLPPLMPTKSESEAVEEADEGLKPKLKPLHWHKVRASSDREMVWDHLRSSSFQYNST